MMWEFTFKSLTSCNWIMSVTITRDNLFAPESKIIDDNLQFLGFIGNKGKLVDSIFSKEFDLPKHEKEMFFMNISLYDHLQRDFENQLGPITFNMSERKDSRHITIPIQSGIIFAILDKHANYEVFVDKMRSILDLVSNNEMMQEILS